MQARLNMSNNEIEKLRVIRDVIAKKLKWLQGACILDISQRQIARLCVRVRKQGNRGVIHGLSGQLSNNRLDPELLGQALSALHNPRWEGFGPTYSQEKLREFYDIVLGEGTVRKLMTLTGIWK